MVLALVLAPPWSHGVKKQKIRNLNLAAEAGGPAVVLALVLAPPWSRGLKGKNIRNLTLAEAGGPAVALALALALARTKTARTKTAKTKKHSVWGPIAGIMFKRISIKNR